MKAYTLFATALLAASALSHPIQSDSEHQLNPRASQSPADILLVIAPKSSSCASASFKDECVTANDAAQPIIASFSKYGLSTPGEQAALLSWMAFESGDFEYNKNHFPGVPGQGMRCMISPSFVQEFAFSVQVQNADPAGLVQDLLKAGHEWDACSWFYKTKCSAEIQTGVQSGTKAGNDAFITSCVSTTNTQDRQAGWVTAAKALGLSGS